MAEVTTKPKKVMTEDKRKRKVGRVIEQETEQEYILSKLSLGRELKKEDRMKLDADLSLLLLDK